MDVNAELPPDFEWYQNQIAGHLPSVIRNGVRQIGILHERGRTDVILKLVQEGIRGQREIGFYRRIAAICEGQGINCEETDEVEDTLLKELAMLIPRFYGCREILLDENGPPKEFIQLEDVTEKFKFPCIMDVKMGRVSADPLASEEKRMAEEVKSPLQKKIGFRILGHRVQNEDGLQISRERIWGRERTEENIEEAFVEYLTSLRSTADSFKIVDEFVKQLDQVLCWFQQQKIAHFYASSLLFVYEGHSKLMPSVSLSMIDFSHVFFVQKTEAKMDENYMFGLIHIIKLFRKIRRDLLLAIKLDAQ
ncbi:hypothetical protein niasHT_030789 [Heterodera trifolii]|uniref:Kinase n=1 Tax=Heterodera trifolii TaxID=157864 RepID=A0ABD2HXE9_9BILA